MAQIAHKEVSMEDLDGFVFAHFRDGAPLVGDAIRVEMWVASLRKMEFQRLPGDPAGMAITGVEASDEELAASIERLIMIGMLGLSFWHGNLVVRAKRHLQERKFKTPISMANSDG